MDTKAYTQSEGVQILFATAHGFFVEKGNINFAGKQAAFGRELPQVDGSFRPILLNNSLDNFLRRKYAAPPSSVAP